MDLDGHSHQRQERRTTRRTMPIQMIWLFCRWKKMKLTTKVFFHPLPGDQKCWPDHFLAPNSTKLQRGEIWIQIKAFNQPRLRCNHGLLSQRSNGVCARKAPTLMTGLPEEYDEPILVWNYICILEIMRYSIFAHISLLWHCNNLLFSHFKEPYFCLLTPDPVTHTHMFSIQVK